ncbi:MAG: 1-phosphofructokinase family hexose kinase [Saprospiraceae bacterium]|nr:1-phosphofructokinase family hexose kinase [Saprospiraceae bacterium]
MKQNILTITFNPSVDKSSRVDKIVPEKKLRCISPIYEPGGGGINVSRALKRLGVEADTFFLSGGRAGDLLGQLLENEAIKSLPFPIAGESRENFIVVDESNGQQYRFGMPGSNISEAEQNNILRYFDEKGSLPSFVVISGSLPPGMSNIFLRKLISSFKRKGSKVIVDTSGEALKEAANENVFLLKPNLGELAALTGKEEIDGASIIDAAKTLIHQKMAEVVVVSLGAKGALLCTVDEYFLVHAPLIKVRSTVGAGDSMVAGMVYVMANGGGFKEMLQMGVACGSATTMATGTGLFKKENVESLLEMIKSH